MAKQKKQFESAPEADEYVQPEQVQTEQVAEVENIEVTSDEFIKVTWKSGSKAGKTELVRKTAADIYKQKGLI